MSSQKEATELFIVRVMTRLLLVHFAQNYFGHLASFSVFAAAVYPNPGEFMGCLYDSDLLRGGLGFGDLHRRTSHSRQTS